MDTPVSLKITERELPLFRDAIDRISGIEMQNYNIKKEEVLITYKFDFNLFYLGSIFGTNKLRESFSSLYKNQE